MSRIFDVRVIVTLEKDYYGLTEEELDENFLIADTTRRGWVMNKEVNAKEIKQ